MQPEQPGNVPPVNPNKALWEKGDFTRIAATMRESGEALVSALGITKGAKVLDLACGDGTKRELEALFTSQNKSPDRTTIPATFLRVTVAR
jgi:hypothetical protein